SRLLRVLLLRRLPVDLLAVRIPDDEAAPDGHLHRDIVRPVEDAVVLPEPALLLAVVAVDVQPARRPAGSGAVPHGEDAPVAAVELRRVDNAEPLERLDAFEDVGGRFGLLRPLDVRLFGGDPDHQESGEASDSARHDGYPEMMTRSPRPHRDGRF